MVRSVSLAASVAISFCALAVGTPRAGGDQVLALAPGNMGRNAWESDSWQSLLTLVRLQQHDGRLTLVIADRNYVALLSAILDQHVEEDPNEPEEYLGSGGLAGGGITRAPGNLSGSGFYAGSTGRGGLMSIPAPQVARPPHSGTLMPAAGTVVDSGTGGTIEPIPYPGDDAVVPEPTTIVTLGLGSIVLLHRREP